MFCGRRVLCRSKNRRAQNDERGGEKIPVNRAMFNHLDSRRDILSEGRSGEKPGGIVTEENGFASDVKIAPACDATRRLSLSVMAFEAKPNKSPTPVNVTSAI